MPADHPPQGVEPRIPPVEGDLSQADLERMREHAAPVDLGGLTQFNVVRTMAHHPDLLTRYLTFGLHLRRSSTLSDRLRTIVSLRTAALSGADYEWRKHAGHAAAREMLTAEEIDATRTDVGTTSWSPVEAAVVRAVEQLCTSMSIDDDTWTTISTELDHRQQLDLVFTVGHYTMLAMAVHALRIQLEDDE